MKEPVAIWEDEAGKHEEPFSMCPRDVLCEIAAGHVRTGDGLSGMVAPGFNEWWAARLLGVV